jgi:hypothetical protein
VVCQARLNLLRVPHALDGQHFPEQRDCLAFAPCLCWVDTQNPMKSTASASCTQLTEQTRAFLTHRIDTYVSVQNNLSYPVPQAPNSLSRRF